MKYNVTLIVEVNAENKDSAVEIACNAVHGYSPVLWDIERIDADHGFSEKDEDDRIEALAEAYDDDLLARYDSDDLDLVF